MFYCGLGHLNFTHILQGNFTGTGAIIWLPQFQWSNPDKYDEQANHMNLLITDEINTIKQITLKWVHIFQYRCISL